MLNSPGVDLPSSWNIIVLGKSDWPHNQPFDFKFRAVTWDAFRVAGHVLSSEKGISHQVEILRKTTTCSLSAR